LPVLFVLTRRDRPARSDADALLADLAGRGLDVTEIEPGPLRRAEVAEVVRSVATLPDAMVSQVVVAADGNPLLAVESARAVAAGSSAPPSSLRAVVRAALGALPEPARALAEAIAAAGPVCRAVGPCSLFATSACVGQGGTPLWGSQTGAAENFIAVPHRRLVDPLRELPCSSRNSRHWGA
jgi:hypothetical protein